MSNEVLDLMSYLPCLTTIRICVERFETDSK
jgi:hypothetical protein